MSAPAKPLWWTKRALQVRAALAERQKAAWRDPAIREKRTEAIRAAARKRRKCDLLGHPLPRHERDRNAEARVQAAVVDWIRLVSPRVIVYAIPNGGLRTKAEAARMRWTGTLAGMPDLGLVLPGGRAAFFEIKAPKRGRLSEEQKDILVRLYALGADPMVVRSIDDARAAFKAWGVETREATTAPASLLKRARG